MDSTYNLLAAGHPSRALDIFLVFALNEVGMQRSSMGRMALVGLLAVGACVGDDADARDWVTRPAEIQAYTPENRSIVSSGINRSFVLSLPSAIPAGLPLVFSLHGDGGSGNGARASLPLEAQANDGAIFVYPNAPGGTFEYFTDIGRTREVQFVRDVIALLVAEFDIDPTRVFLTGFSGGATMANAVGCRMEADEIRGLGINAGSLYPLGNDFTYTGNGGVSCDLPATMFVWGEDDMTGGVSFATGMNVRNNYRATQNCATTSTPRAPAPCIQYDGCTRDVAWCAIPGMQHSIWVNAAPAIWDFFTDQLPDPEPVTTQIVYDDALRNSFEDFSWGDADFASVAAPRTGSNAIRFTAYDFEGLSFARPAMPVSVAQYPELRFWIRGAIGGEDFDISLQSGAVEHVKVPLAPFVDGGAIVAGAWREVRVPFGAPPMSYVGTFQRINVQDSSGATMAAPQIVDIDDVVLVASGEGMMFADGFEGQ